MSKPPDKESSDIQTGGGRVLECMIPSLSDGVLVIGPQGEILRVNQALCAILEIEESELLGKSWAELFFGDKANQALNQMVVEVLQSHTPVKGQRVGYTAPGGGKKELSASITLTGESGGERGLVVVLKDLTELEGLHQRERGFLERTKRLFLARQEALDRIARAVAHEVRNPVAGIGGLAARVLKSEDQGSKTHAYMQRILELTARLETIVEQVHAYAYLPQPNRREVELVSWMRTLLDRYTNRASAQKVELSLEAPRSSGIIIQMDPQLIFSALSSLVKNSLEAMPQGGHLSVTLTNTGSEAEIRCRDNGRGINPADLPFLFDPFYTTKAEAVGMSLAIAQRIIGEHFGEILVESQEGQGTTCTITLPLAPPRDSGQDGRPAQPK